VTRGLVLGSGACPGLEPPRGRRAKPQGSSSARIARMSRVAPPGAKAPARGAWASSPRDCPTPTAGSAPGRGAGKGQMRTHLRRPKRRPAVRGAHSPRPPRHSGKAWCRAASAEAFRPARTCPCACPQGLPERSEGAAGHRPPRAEAGGRASSP